MAEYNELQSLTTPKGTYDSFPDKKVREQLEEATFNHLTLETANANDGDNGVILTPEGSQDAPVLALYGKNGDEPVVIRNAAEAVSDGDVPNLGQVKALLNGQDSGQNVGFPSAAASLLETVLKACATYSDQTANIDALIAILMQDGTAQEGVTQSGSVLTIISGVTATQDGDTLTIT